MLGTAAGSPAAVVREIGEYSDVPLPQAGCPLNCQAIGHVTGYQVQIGPHRTRSSSSRTARSSRSPVRLSKPDAQQTQFFTNLFGGRPRRCGSRLLRTARTAKQAQLMAQAGVQPGELPRLDADVRPIEAARSHLGLDAHPITVPTWAPAFAINLGADEAWRSSRPKNDCNGTSQAAQQTVEVAAPSTCASTEPRGCSAALRSCPTRSRRRRRKSSAGN